MTSSPEHRFRNGVCVYCRLTREQIAQIEALEAFAGGLLAIAALAAIVNHPEAVAEIFDDAAKLLKIAEADTAGNSSPPGD